MSRVCEYIMFVLCVYLLCVYICVGAGMYVCKPVTVDRNTEYNPGDIETLKSHYLGGGQMVGIMYCIVLGPCYNGHNNLEKKKRFCLSGKR